MCNNRNGRIHDSSYLLADLGTAFKLYSIGSALFDKSACIDNSLLYADLIGHERHIGYDESVFRTS